MSHASWVELLSYASVDGAALSNTTTPTSLLPATAKRTLQAGLFENVGQQVLIMAHGRLSSLVTSPGNLSLDFRLGATAVIASGAIPLNAVAKTNVGWWYQMLATIRAIGTSANFIPGGFWLSEGALNVAVPSTGPGPGGNVLPYNAAPAVGSNFDSTASLVADFFGTFSVANAANSITLHQLSVHLLN